MDISAMNQVDALFKQVVDAMQDAEEMGGPEGEFYQLLMHRISQETKSRAKTHWLNELAPAGESHMPASTLLSQLEDSQAKALASITSGAVEDALLHTRMLGLYLSRLVEHPDQTGPLVLV